MLYSLIQPFIFKLPPEQAHCLAMQALEFKLKIGGYTPPPKVAARQVMGLNFSNPVGLAAGFDKNGQHVDALGNLGFGFIEIGGVTPKAQPGNPRPRIFRLPEIKGIINRMGFNNVGADEVARNLKNRQYGGIVGVNLGKNATTSQDDAITDYITGIEKLYAVGDFFTLNLSSPNTANLRDWQHGDAFINLVNRVINKRDELANASGKYAPIAVKISPDNEESALLQMIEAIKQCGIEGVIATNTTIERPPAILDFPYAKEQGGLSGLPLKEQSTQVVRLLRQNLPSSVAIIGVGGIMTADDMQEKFDAGADLIQFYTGLVYNGPNFPQQLLNALESP